MLWPGLLLPLMVVSAARDHPLGWQQSYYSTEANVLSVSLERATALKQALRAFVLESEGDLAIALETYSADQMAKWSKTQLQGISRSDLVVDMFCTEGRVDGLSPLELFLQHQSQLSAAEQALVQRWQSSFNGLFAVLSRSQDEQGNRVELRNWLTEKTYQVRATGLQPHETLARLQPGEVVVTRLSPLLETDAGDREWMFSGPLQLLGKLGKPKLAVAIGTFKDQFNQHLYGDAPELMAEAWLSVERFHQRFIDYFETDEVTLPGYQLDQKITAFQTASAEQQLAAAGLDSSQSLSDLARQSGLSEAEMAASAAAVGQELGADADTAQALLDGQRSLKMVMPKTSLPETLRRAEQVTLLVHPRWGQTYLVDYAKLKQRLSEPSADPETAAAAELEALLLKYLKDPTVNAHVWCRLAHQFAAPLEAGLQRSLARPEFDLKHDLDDLLRTFGKPLQPDLPEIASVPLHLHNLFQEALGEVGQSQGKGKGKDKGKSKAKRGGFG
jgi:hypothetical protein